MYKKSILIVLVAVVASLFWFWLKPWVDSPTRFSDVGIWLKPLLALSLLASLVGLNFFLLKNSGLRLLASVVAGLPFLIVFGALPFYVGAFALMVLLHLYASTNIQQEGSERTTINVRLTLQRGLSMIIMPFLIMISFAFFLSPGIQMVSASRQLPPTVKQVVETTVGNFLGQQIQSLPPQQQQQAKNQIVSQVLEQITIFSQPYFKFLPPILAFGLFLVLQGLSFIFIWLSVLFGWLIFTVLKKSGFFRINIVQKQAEQLEF
jgi:hypothetical protein